MPAPATISVKKTGLHTRDLLLLIPVVALLFPSLYARREPMLFGFPFFYWYQFAWVPLGAMFTLMVFLLRRRATKTRGPR